MKGGFSLDAGDRLGEKLHLLLYQGVAIHDGGDQFIFFLPESTSEQVKLLRDLQAKFFKASALSWGVGSLIILFNHVDDADEFIGPRLLMNSSF